MPRPVKSAEARTKMLAVRVPPHLYDRVADYAQRYGISLTDSAILALYRGFGDHRGIVLHKTYAAPRRAQQPARSDPCEPLSGPADEEWK
jgi:hypothetical protein